MKDKRKKASMSQIKKIVKPHVTKKVLGRDIISEKEIKALSQEILPYYSNVEISSGCFDQDGKTLLKIEVKGLLSSEELFLEVHA